MKLLQAINEGKFDEIAKAIFDAVELEGSDDEDRQEYFDDQSNVGNDLELLMDVEDDQRLMDKSRIDIICASTGLDSGEVMGEDVVSYVQQVIDSMSKGRVVKTFQDDDLVVIYGISTI